MYACQRGSGRLDHIHGSINFFPIRHWEWGRKGQLLRKEISSLGHGFYELSLNTKKVQLKLQTCEGSYSAPQQNPKHVLMALNKMCKQEPSTLTARSLSNLKEQVKLMIG